MNKATVTLTGRQRAVLVTLLRLDNQQQRAALASPAFDEEEQAKLRETIAENEELLTLLKGGD